MLWAGFRKWSKWCSYYIQMVLQLTWTALKCRNPRRKLDKSYAHHTCKCLVPFMPVQSLLTCFRSFLTHFADFVSKSLPQTLRLFLRFIVFSGSPTAVHCPLHALRYYTVGIPFWTARKDSHKRLSLTEKLQYHVLKSLDHTLPLHTCYEEIYGSIAREENGWLSHSNVSL